MLLARVVTTSTAVAATRSRTKKAQALAALLVDPEAAGLLRIVVPWLVGELPQGRVGIGYAALVDTRKIPAAGEATLTVDAVDAALTSIGAMSGPGSAKTRRAALAELFGQATAAEQHFLGPLLAGELRQGALDGVMAEAVATAAAVRAADVRRASMLSGNLVAAALAALEGGTPALAAFRLEVFRPILPMLASTAEGVDDAAENLGPEARYEVKLDGARVQVHCRDGEVRVWTRALLPVTDVVPEIVELVSAFPARELVLDGEVLAFTASGRPHPFQTTMRRFGRRKDIDGLRSELPLTPMFFDLLHLDGETLLDRPLAERIGALERVVPERYRIPAVTTADRAAAKTFLAEALAGGHEGVMAKGTSTAYEAGTRGDGWLKIKPAWTLDLVVLAAEWGSGRRRGTLSNLHLGARDASNGRFVMLGKTFKGLTDEMLAWQTTALLEREVRRDGHIVWVRPELVVEIAFNEVQASPRYPGGVALRFARVKGYRPDKSAAEADTLQQVRAIFAGTAPR